MPFGDFRVSLLDPPLRFILPRDCILFFSLVCFVFLLRVTRLSVLSCVFQSASFSTACLTQTLLALAFRPVLHRRHGWVCLISSGPHDPSVLYLRHWDGVGSAHQLYPLHGFPGGVVGRVRRGKAFPRAATPPRAGYRGRVQGPLEPSHLLPAEVGAVVSRWVIVSVWSLPVTGQYRGSEEVGNKHLSVCEER